jgi:hypothetical protein
MNNWYKDINLALEAKILEDHQDSVVDSSDDLLDLSINNQGYGHSLNPAPIITDNVRHRMPYECLMTKALIRRRILFAPMPLFLYGSQRIEPDYVIFKDGFSVLVELDGSSHEFELASKEQSRLKFFRDNLFQVMRFSIPDDPDINFFNDVLKEVEGRIEKLSNLHGSRA